MHFGQSFAVRMDWCVAARTRRFWLSSPRFVRSSKGETHRSCIAQSPFNSLKNLICTDSLYSNLFFRKLCREEFFWTSSVRTTLCICVDLEEIPTQHILRIFLFFLGGYCIVSHDPSFFHNFNNNITYNMQFYLSNLRNLNNIIWIRFFFHIFYGFFFHHLSFWPYLHYST